MRAGSAWPARIREPVARFFGIELDRVELRVDLEPLRYSALAFTTGERIHVLPDLFDPGSRSGLHLLGHELAHVAQQRCGLTEGRGSPASIVEDAELEAQADRLAARFASWALDPGAGTGDREFLETQPLMTSASHGVLQRKVWEPGREIKPNDALFWHCTTFPSVVKLYQAEKINIKLGGGWQGPGFYVTTQRSDYVKIMALRNNQQKPHPLLFFLYLLVDDFYNLRAEFKDDFGTPSDPAADFVGVRWGGHIKGPFGKPEQTVKLPEGTKGRATLPGGHAIIGGYQGEEMWTLGMKLDRPETYDPNKWYEHTPVKGGRSLAFGTGNWKQRESQQHQVLGVLWDLAQRNDRNGNTGNAALDLAVRMMGPRKALMGTLEELTFVSENCSTRIHVVGARVFSETPTTLYSDLGAELVTSNSPYAGTYGESRIDFDNDKWIDMDFLEELIQVEMGTAFVGAGTGSSKAPSKQEMMNRPRPPGARRGGSLRK